MFKKDYHNLVEIIYLSVNYSSSLVDFNISFPSQGLFNAEGFENHVHGTFIFTFLRSWGLELLTYHLREFSGNLLSFLLRCGTRPYERGTQ